MLSKEMKMGLIVRCIEIKLQLMFLESLRMLNKWNIIHISLNSAISRLD